MIIEHELARRRREQLVQSLQSPHPQSRDMEDAGLLDWAAHLPVGDEGLVDPTQGKAIRWVEGQGWVELDE